MSTQDVLNRFVAALGGMLKLIADFGDEQLKIARLAGAALAVAFGCAQEELLLAVGVGVGVAVGLGDAGLDEK